MESARLSVSDAADPSNPDMAEHPRAAGLVRDICKSCMAGNIPATRHLLETASALGIRDAVVLKAINWLEQQWSMNDAGLTGSLGAFWTLNRALDRGSRANPSKGDDRKSPKDVTLFVPFGENHTFGVQMLADQLSARGLAVKTLICVPKSDLFDFLADHPTNVLGISVGYDKSLAGLANLIAEARIVSTRQTMTVAVGGQVFDGPDSAYDFLGADVVLGNNVRDKADRLFELNQ